MDLNVNSGVWGTMFGIPCIVADNFLKLATGNQIKVLIYILRHAGRPVSSDELSSMVGISRDEAEESVMFWQQANIFATDNHTAVQSIMSPPLPHEPVKTVQPENTSESVFSPARPKKTMLTASEIAEIINNDSDVAELFRCVESLLGSVNYTMQNTLIRIHSEFGLKTEVVMTLITYCKEINNINPRNIERTAENWRDSGINSLDSALNEVQKLSSIQEYRSKIMRIFKVNDIAKKYEKFIEQWKQWNISLELVTLAYERTLEQINKLSYPYINKILISWHNEGFTDVKDVENSEKKYKDSRKSSGAPLDGFDAEKYKIFINNV
ncbi:MAG: DnaD domain protein [Ruminococcus sp.]|nr:DnaD domain protein [Ruminococcus sp.]MDE7225588.1 DnaD domain protein [Ruminococcus sp.]